MSRSVQLGRVVAVALVLVAICWSVQSPSAMAGPPPKSPAAKPQPKQSAPPPALRSGQAAIEAALAKPIRAEFVETPLTDVLDFFKDMLRISIHLDRKAIADAGVEPKATVTFSGVDLPFETILGAMLGQLGLTWTIDDGMLLVTSREVAEQKLTVCVYDVADLVVCRDGKNQPWDDYETLIDVILQTVEPVTWQSAGGAGTIAGASLGTAKVIVIGQTYQNHRRIARLLQDIRGVAAKSTRGAEPPRRDRPVVEKPEKAAACPCGFPPTADAGKK